MIRVPLPVLRLTIDAVWIPQRRGNRFVELLALEPRCRLAGTRYPACGHSPRTSDKVSVSR